MRPACLFFTMFFNCRKSQTAPFEKTEASCFLDKRKRERPKSSPPKGGEYRDTETNGKADLCIKNVWTHIRTNLLCTHFRGDILSPIGRNGFGRSCYYNSINLPFCQACVLYLPTPTFALRFQIPFSHSESKFPVRPQENCVAVSVLHVLQFFYYSDRNH